jgi:WD40 repeat protein
MVTSADGAYIAVQNGDHAVQVFGVDTLELAATIDLPETAITTLAFGGSRSLLAVGTADGKVQFWSPDEPQLDTLPGNGVVAGLAFRSDGQSLVIIRNAGSINTLWLFDRETGGQTAILVYDVPLANAVFSADGSQIIVGTLDGRVLVLDVNGAQ